MLQAKARAWVEIDCDAIAHNLEEVKKLIPSTCEVMAVVKANAYGHGDVMVAKTLQQQGVKSFAVSSVDEALNLREAGIEGMILILGYTPEEHFHYLAEQQITQTLISLEYAQKIDAYCQRSNQTIDCHIKADTGLSRVGIRTLEDDYQIEEIFKIYEMKYLHVTGIFSHFAVSDSLDNLDDVNYTQKQLKMFEKVLSDIRQAGYVTGKVHMQNSYGVLNYPELNYDYVRPGILLLGFTSDDSIRIKTNPKFVRSLQFYANVSCVKTVKAGSFVSYGRNYQAKTDRKIATISCGYADGIPRHLSNCGIHVLVNGKRVPLIGNICMDQCMADVSELDDIKEGDIVTLIGKSGDEEVTIDEWSRCVKSINNDLMCQITARVPRFYK